MDNGGDPRSEWFGELAFSQFVLDTVPTREHPIPAWSDR
jgi:hypothetical protein